MGIVFAVLKNGMWDDPAVANTGSIASEMSELVEKSGLWSGRAEKYLTWRCCYLLCAALFTAADLGAGLISLDFDGRKHMRFISARMPKGFDLSAFKHLAYVVARKDGALWACQFVSFCFLLAGCILALPCFAISSLRKSRGLVWLAWVSLFSLPFGVLLVFPVRSVVDWAEVRAGLCAVSIENSFALPGSSVRDGITTACENGILAETGCKKLVADIPSWCALVGDDWFEAFDTITGCTWAVEDLCRAKYCSAVEMDSCLPACITQRASHGALEDEANACLNGSKPFEMGPRPQMPAGRSDVLAFYEVLSYSNRVAVRETAQVAYMLGLRLETLVGLLISAGAGAHLLPMALSVVSGLAEALINVKAVFPGLQQPGWSLVQVTLQTVPIYAVMLVMIQQTAGDQWIAVACTLTVVYFSVSAMTGYRSLTIRCGAEERERFYRQIWLEYGTRFLLVVGVALAVLLSRRGAEVKRQAELGLRDQAGIVMAIFTYLSSKILTAVAATDLVLHAMLKSELWEEGMSEAERQDHDAALADLGALTGAMSEKDKEDEGADGDRTGDKKPLRPQRP